MTLNTLQGLDFVCSYTLYTKKQEGVSIGCIVEGVGGEGGWSIGNRGKGWGGGEGWHKGNREEGVAEVVYRE
jgi:hypothetical protein